MEQQKIKLNTETLDAAKTQDGKPITNENN